MSSIARVALVAVLAAAGVSCDDDEAVQGSGIVITEPRAVSGFEEIALEGTGELIVEVGGAESLTIEAEDNLLPLLTSEVAGSRLVLSTSDPISPTLPITYRAVATTLEGVSISGSGDVVVSDLDCTVFEAAVSGSGTFVMSGTCDRLQLSISGSGDFDGEDLQLAEADVSINGSGDALLMVSDELRVSINGSGNVEYLGDPVTDLDINGSGSVNKR